MTKETPNQNRFDEWLARGKTLRADMNRAQHALMEHLVEGENDPSLWAATGLAFGVLIEHAGLAKCSEYEAWKRGRQKLVEVVGEDGACTVSFEATKRVAPMQRSEDVEEMVRVDALFLESNGVPMSPTAAHDWSRKIRLVSAAGRNRNRSIADMEREIERLRVKVAALEEERKTLRAELRAARKASKAA